MRDLKALRLLRYLAICFVITLFFFALVEGLSSMVYVATLVNSARERPVAESLHTRFDSELGWVNIPNAYVPNMYGEGISLRTNSQGFRNNQDFAQHVPPGKFRAVCSGDSFTLGYGVANDQTWCHQLAALDQRLEAINMGQGGYGIDQAYLWYARDGSKVNHDLHIFAFIEQDFGRMGFDRFLGFAKPALVLQENQLVVKNTPIPKPVSLSPFLSRVLPALDELRTIRALSFVSRRLRRQKPAGSIWTEAQERSRPVALKVFETLREMNAKAGRQLALVYLPVELDCDGDAAGEDLRRYLRKELEPRGFLYWDLTEDFQKLPVREMKKMFIAPGQVAFRNAQGHYTAEGNKFAAELIYKRMLATPTIAQRLNAAGASVHSGGVQAAR